MFLISIRDRVYLFQIYPWMFLRSIKEVSKLISKGMFLPRKTKVLKNHLRLKYSSTQDFGELQITQVSLNFKTSWKSEVQKNPRKRVTFLLLCCIFEIFLFNRIHPFFHLKRPYWKCLMMEEESRNFLTWFYSNLWLPQRYVYLTLKIIANWTRLAKNSKLSGCKLMTEYFESKFQLCFHWPIQC